MKITYIALTATTIGMMRCRPSLKASYDASLVSAQRCIPEVVDGKELAGTCPRSGLSAQCPGNTRPALWI